MTRRSMILRRTIRPGGFTLFEFLVALIVIGIIAAVLIDRMRYWEEYAEKLVVETTVHNMRSGLRWQVAELMSSNRMGEIPRLLHDNPVNWLRPLPSNYIGAFDDPSPDRIPGGSWYFDNRRKELVYRLHHHRHFQGGSDLKAIRYRVIALTDRPGGQKGAASKVEGITLVLVNPYKWF